MKKYCDLARSQLPSDAARKDFRETVKKSKNAFYRKKLEDANKNLDAFQIAKWHKTKENFHIPPLIDLLSLNSPPTQSNQEKRNILFNNLLQNHSNLTLDELSNAVLNAGNTTPGKDGTPTAVLRLAWAHTSRLIIELFQSCINTGHHPQCFRTEIVIVIGKPNKADMSSPRSYRPIALLSVLGKGLERLVARRMAWTAIRFKVISQHQFGALPLRSSVDLTTCLTHDVEIALAKGETASVATLDIKGVFDAVLLGRLIRRLREQDSSAHLCNWISSFATGMKVCIRLDSEEGTPRDIIYGLPQGSSIPPILFMLYLSPLFRLDNLRKSFGYPDDVAILETSPSLDTNADRIGTAVNQVVSCVAENPAHPYLKWLGVHFDRKLSFKHHAQVQTAKAPKVARAIRCFGNTISEVPPHLSRQAVAVCVLPIAHFAAETWWPGRTRKKGRKTVSIRVGSHLAVLDKLYSTVARAILPAYRTTPWAALLREAGLQPAELTPDTISIRAAIRTRRLNSRHPLFV
ncbi:hypothetical protein K3495_g4334 [Podosphaera aphanis]|nr:hypothetical protein K3495_g4334 [Podosphaera aphanis]